LKPGFLSRGYGGRLKQPTLVDPQIHSAADVGDEPLLLAREAMTVISRRRPDGARRLIEAGADLIIMDDGFQSASLVLDYALVVIDTVRGIGNGHLVPGGPVRAPLDTQMQQVSAILKVGSGHAADALVRQAARAGKPVFVATLTPRDAADLAGVSVLAFAGIADPAKFYRTLEGLGARIVEKRAFGDHAQLSEAEIADLLDEAARHHLQLVTTSKDFVRLAGGKGRAAELAERCRVVEVEMTFDDHNGPGQIIETAFANFSARRLRENHREGR
jgi:tetraacyldisaccharide 4'-kinase